MRLAPQIQNLIAVYVKLNEVIPYHISVNKRLIKNPLIYKSIADTYKDQIAFKRFPLVVLNLTIQNSLVDVNIHPQKQDIKFVNPGFLFDCIPKIE